MQNKHASAQANEIALTNIKTTNQADIWKQNRKKIATQTINTLYLNLSSHISMLLVNSIDFLMVVTISQTRSASRCCRSNSPSTSRHMSSSVSVVPNIESVVCYRLRQNKHRSGSTCACRIQRRESSCV